MGERAEENMGCCGATLEAVAVMQRDPLVSMQSTAGRGRVGEPPPFPPSSPCLPKGYSCAPKHRGGHACACALGGGSSVSLPLVAVAIERRRVWGGVWEEGTVG